jgi:hypothetical protein
VKIDALIERDRDTGTSALPLTSIHPSAWKDSSLKFVSDILHNPAPIA